MGTAGLRKKVAVFQQPHYLACFVQAVLDTIRLPKGATVILGGDGRYYNTEAIRILASVLAGNGVGHLVIGQSGLLSTPAASNLIRVRHADGGFLLTASHNPGGPTGDFGIKFNVANGGQASPQITDEVFAASTRLTGYHIAELPDLDLEHCGTQIIEGLKIEVVDPVDDYLQLMQSLFDFDLMADWISAGHRVLFDGMHGITGPYAQRILADCLGTGADSLLNAKPLPDFGGRHPDPNPVDAGYLLERAGRTDSPALIAASDGDGDRNMIVGPGGLVSPGDSVAVMLALATKVPGYRRGITGAARSMPTSRALDVVARSLSIPVFETPTGWRFFCNLLEAGRIGLCGEESFGTGSDHVREKDGLWAVLFWLNLLAAENSSIPRLMHRHWQQFGRHYYQRQDFAVSDAERAEAVMRGLRDRVARLTGRPLAGGSVELADDFSYHDPVDGSETAQQGIRIVIDSGARMIYRLSGTGTSGATLRVYMEKYESDPSRLGLPVGDVLAPVASAAFSLAEIERCTGLTAPTMVV